jgi:hypothetical protein
MLFVGLGHYISGRFTRNRFTCNCAQVLFFGGVAQGGMTLAEGFHSNLIANLGQARDQPDLASLLARDSYALPLALAFSALAAVLISVTYDRVELPKAIPFWNGFVTCRRAALYRSWFRFWVKTLEKAPLFGGILKTLRALIASTEFFKSEGRALHVADVATIVTFVLAALTIVYAFDGLVFWYRASFSHLDATETAQHHEIDIWARSVGWASTAIGLAILGTARREMLFLIASTGFAIVPIFYFKKPPSLSEAGDALISIGHVGLSIGLAIVFCGILRWLFPFGIKGHRTNQLPDSGALRKS